MSSTTTTQIVPIGFVNLSGPTDTGINEAITAQVNILDQNFGFVTFLFPTGVGPTAIFPDGSSSTKVQIDPTTLQATAPIPYTTNMFEGTYSCTATVTDINSNPSSPVVSTIFNFSNTGVDVGTISVGGGDNQQTWINNLFPGGELIVSCTNPQQDVAIYFSPSDEGQIIFRNLSGFGGTPTTSAFTSDTGQATTQNVVALNPSGTYPQSVAIEATANGTTSSTTFNLTIQNSPTIIAEDATSVGITEATLNASVNPNDTSATNYFQFTTNSSFIPDPANTTTIFTSGTGDTIAGIYADRSGNIYLGIASGAGDNLTEISPDGTSLNTLALPGEPIAITVDNLANIYVILDASGQFSVNFIEEFQSIIPISGFTLAVPISISTDSNNNLYLADLGELELEVKNFNTSLNTTVPIILDATSIDFGHSNTCFYISNGDILMSNLTTSTVITTVPNPTFIAVTADKTTLYVVSKNKTIVQIDVSNGNTTTLIQETSPINSVAVDLAGNLFYAVENILKKVTTGIVSVLGNISGETPVSINAIATGLTPNSNYNFRAISTNFGGISVGDSLSFQTLEI